MTIPADWNDIEDLRPNLDALAAVETAGKQLRAVLSAVERAGEDVDRIWPSTPDRLATIYRWMNGQPRAAAFEPASPDPDHPHSTGTPMWCWRHERDLRECPADELCGGVPYRPGADPTGEAGCTPDKAAHDHKRLLELLRQRVRTDQAIVTLLLRYPDKPTRPLHSRQASLGDCRAHYRIGTLADVATKVDGTVRHSGLCRRCGEFRSEYKVDPPLAVLRLWHVGRRPGPDVVAKAIADEKTWAKSGKR